MRWSKRTHIGHVRRVNEDSVLVEPDLGLLIVADGMGGHLAGEIASKLAVETMARHIRENCHRLPDEPATVLSEGVAAANMRVYDLARGQQEYAGMGTTLTAGLLRGYRLYLVHVGDSRAYLLRNNNLSQLSEDHSFVNELVRNGGLSLEEASCHPQRNILTKALGTGENLLPDLTETVLEPGDKLVFCSDGLTNPVPLAEMQEIVSGAEGLEQAADQLLETALAKGGRDNISFILAEIE